MEQSSTTIHQNIENNTGIHFIILGLVALITSAIFGVLSALKFQYPGLIDELIFHKLRPIHVSLAISWIFLAVVGGIYYYLPRVCGLPLFSAKLASLHFWGFLITGLSILGCLVTGRFGGREYFVYPPVLSLPVFITWAIFAFNIYRTIAACRKPWPVYYWMWSTGILFFMITLTETYLWLIPYFRENMVREITIQWKSFGAMVGSWNMLVYGTAIFVMDKISGDNNTSSSDISFYLYFLGLIALLFGWAHHVYPVPFASWVRTVAYAVSMFELIILGRIIWNWRRRLDIHRLFKHRQSSRLLFSADMWVLLNLILALCMSVPAFNLYTHGTHVTVAHTMGTTIGINTMILLGSIFFIMEERSAELPAGKDRVMQWGTWILNSSLVLFLLSLIAAGVYKGLYPGGSHQEMMQQISPFLLMFTGAGLGVFTGISFLVIPAIKTLCKLCRNGRASTAKLPALDHS